MKQSWVLAIACIGLSASCQSEERRLVPASAIIGDALPAPLDGRIGDPQRGQIVFVERTGGHCVLCHVHDQLDAPFQGELGPDLSRVSDNLSPGQIRLRIVDMSVLAPETIMPPYYRIHDLHQVEHGLEGQPVLSSQDVEDLTAFLNMKTDSS